MVFAITRLAPGGPLEQAMMQMQQVSEEGGGGRSSGSNQALSLEQLEQMKRLYGFDKPHWQAYLIWLGILPRETEFRQIRFLADELELSERVSLPSFPIAQLDWDKDGYLQYDEVPPHISKYINFKNLDKNSDYELDNEEINKSDSIIQGAREKVILKRDRVGGVTIMNLSALLGNWNVRMKERSLEQLNAVPVAELFMTQHEGVLQGNFGQSTRFGEPVLQVIAER